MKTCALIVALLANACGYSELEMQAQRDKTTNVINALQNVTLSDSRRRRFPDAIPNVKRLYAGCRLSCIASSGLC